MSNKSKNIAVVFLAIIGVFVLFAIVVGITMSLSSNINIDADSSNISKQIEYERISIEKNVYIGRPRFIVKIVVNEKTTREELIEISKNVLNETIEERRWFQALTIHYHNSVNLADNQPALGTFTYAPHGKWESDEDGKSDFSNYQGNASQLKQKDWSKVPSNFEIELFKSYSNFELKDDGIEFISNKYSIDNEEAKNHIDKVYKWIYE